MNIQENLITINKMSRPSIKLNNVNKVVIHYSYKKSSSALDNRNYFDILKDQNRVYKSSHYIIGLEGEIIRCIPEDEVSYNTGNNNINLSSISIENCYINSDGKFNNSTINSLVELLSDICIRYNLNPMIDIIRHYDISSKICPLYYVNNIDEFNNIKIRVNDMINKPIIFDKYIVEPIIGLNVRISPDINSKKLTAYKYKDIVLVGEIIDGFGKTKDGYVSMNYLKKI